MTFEEAVKVGKVVVVAGAGISKDSPANLPSWWDYNIILLECIEKMGSKALESDHNLLNMETVKREISIHAWRKYDTYGGRHLVLSKKNFNCETKGESYQNTPCFNLKNKTDYKSGRMKRK